MRRAIIATGTVMFVLMLMLSSCNTGNRADIRNLLSQASLPYMKNSKLIQVSSYDTTGGNQDRITIGPGKKVTIFNVDGPGMIVRLWFAIDSRDPYFLRRVVIRMYWDDENKPSVEVPFGDFFGCGFRHKPYMSQYLGMTSGGYVCYFPMPFESHARIDIVNETRQEISGLLYQVDYQKFEGALDPQVGYFHAQWNRRIRTDYDSNYVLLKAEGRGHLVGINLNVQSYNGGFSYLEGDEMIYVDGEKKPSIHGTGTEDLFSGGWYFNEGEFSGPYNGLIYKNDSLGQIAAYRLYITDPVPFKKHIKVTIEHGHGNQDIADYSSTVYWYQMEPHSPFPLLPVAGQRIPLRIVKPARMYEAENLRFDLNGLKSKVMDMSDFGPEWGGNKQMFIEAAKGADFRLEINGLREAECDMHLYYSKGPDYGNADIFVNGEKAGYISGYSPYTMPDGIISVKDIKPITGHAEIRFRVTGKDTSSAGYNIGIDGISMEPKRNYIPDWYILGPFPNLHKPGFPRRGLDTAYIPETAMNLKKEYRGASKQPISWKYVKTPDRGFISLAGLVTPHEMVVTYAVTWIYSPDAGKYVFFLGSDDGAKVFLNGREVYRYYGERVAEPDQAEISLNLRRGWNQLLLKIENNMGAYGFYARLLDRENRLVVSADQKNVSTEKK